MSVVFNYISQRVYIHYIFRCKNNLTCNINVCIKRALNYPD